MLRQRENSVSFKAGMLSVAVHAGLLVALLISFNWKATHPIAVAEVELWDSIPAPVVSLPQPVLEPVPIIKELPPVSEPVVEKASEPEPEVDIALEKKQKELEQKKVTEQLKKEKELEQKKKLAEIQAALLNDDLNANKAVSKKTSQNDALKKLQQESLADDQASGDQQVMAAKSAASAGVVNEYKSKIQAKIRANVNKSLCGEGNPQLVFDIGLMPTGQLSGSPKLVKSSGSAACDDAVERAIIASEPLPLPSDASLFSQFRNLKLKFSPKD
jgi:colicin import membrane protein